MSIEEKTKAYWEGSTPAIRRKLIAGPADWEVAMRLAKHSHYDLLCCPEAQTLDKNNAVILDIGCGIGRLMKAFAEKGWKNIIGVDISSAMIQEAKAFMKPHKPKLYVQDMEKPLEALEDSSVDFAYSMLVFQHIPKLDLIRGQLAALHRVLKPGGVVRIQTLLGNPPTEEAFRGNIGIPFRNADAFGELFEAAGFRVVSGSQGLGHQTWIWVTAKK